jgi:hypothetical protein
MDLVDVPRTTDVLVYCQQTMGVSGMRRNSASDSTMRLTKQIFVERFGEPSKFSFRGQCYDARTPTTPCICGRKIRFCFVTYSGADLKVTLGSCCFKFFATTRLAEILEASQVYLLNVVVETQKAEKRQADRLAFEQSRKRWNKIRREAISRLKAYREATGKGWLPEPLFDLQEAVAAPEPRYRQSSKAAKWFATKTEYLQKKLTEADSNQGIMGHEIPTEHQS